MAKPRSKLRNLVEYIAFRSIISLIGAFPLRTSIKIGGLFGKICVKLFPRLKKTAARNLELALPELSQTERKKIIEGVFESLGKQLGLVSHFEKITPEELLEIVKIKGEENIKKLLAQKRGLLFFSGHLGAWEVFNVLPKMLGIQLNILVRRIDNPIVENHVNSIRTKFGAVTIDKSKANRQLFRILNEGGALGILADLNVQEKEGIFVNFFGIPASTTTSIAKLALKTKAAIIPAFAVWENGNCVVYIEPEIPYEITRDKKSVHEITQQITTKIEEYVRKYPDQWLWIHKRWNTRPKGEDHLY
jgi:KDO2-lipid IV(A) lauroyltransferase